MKNYEEMAKCALDARDKYVKKKKRQQALMKRYAPAVLSICFAAAVGSGIWNHMNDHSEIPIKPVTTETTAEKQTETAIYTEKSDITITATETRTEPVTTEQKEETQATGAPPNTAEPITATPSVTSVAPTTELPAESPAESITESPAATDNRTEEPVDEAPSINRPPLHWEEMAVNQQYNMAEFGSPLSFYNTAEKEVSADKIGDYINMAYMSGYDYYTDTYYHCYADAYLINGYTDKELIAIKFEESNEYFVYYYGLSTDEINKEALDEILTGF